MCIFRSLLWRIWNLKYSEFGNKKIMGKVRHYARLCEDTREYSNNQHMYAAEGIYGCFIRWDEHQYLIRFFFFPSLLYAYHWYVVYVLYAYEHPQSQFAGNSEVSLRPGVTEQAYPTRP